MTIGTGQRCPRCHGALDDADDLAACAACLTVAHRECVTEGGACTTLGCARPPAAARGARAPASAEPTRRRWLPIGAALAGVAGLVAGASALLRPPPPPGLAIVDLRVEPASVRVPNLADGCEDEVQAYPRVIVGLGSALPPTVTVRGRLAVWGAAGAPVEVFVNGQPAEVRGGRRVLECGTGRLLPSLGSTPRDTGERWFEVQVADATALDVLARVAGIEARQRIDRPAPVVRPVIVPPVVRPVIVPIEVPVVVDAGPTLGEVSVPPTCEGTMVPVRGWIGACLPGSTLTVRGPEGDVTLPAEAGPFDLVVTVPSPGPHEITVTVTDPHGRRASTARAVVRRDVPETESDDCEGVHPRRDPETIGRCSPPCAEHPR